MWVAVPRIGGKFKFKNTVNKVRECSLSKNTLHFRSKTHPKDYFQSTKCLITLKFYKQIHKHITKHNTNVED